MDASLTQEQEELRQVLRRFLAERSDSARLRRAVRTPAGYDQDLWHELCAAFELPAVLIGTEYGGLGLGFVELALVLEELGRALCPAPYLATAVLGAGALLYGGDEAARKDWLPGIAAGTTIASLAHRAVKAVAAPAADGYLVTGSASHVLDGHVADLLILPADTPAGRSLLAVRGDAAGLTAERLPALDETRSLARVTLRDVPARLLGQPGQAGPVLDRLRDLGVVALAAEAVGGADRCLELTVQHVRTRRQFGRVIGGFQAVKHRCADLYMQVQTARSIAYYAAWTAAEQPAELPPAAMAAQAYCAQVYRHAAAETIQLHGGIGFTWEHDAHLYLKRATASDLLFGGSSAPHARIAERLAAGAASPPADRRYPPGEDDQ